MMARRRGRDYRGHRDPPRPLVGAVGAEALRGVAPALDMWRVTADQAERCAKTHYDELYVEKDEGLVSRTVANLLLNAACNSRLLPSDELL